MKEITFEAFSLSLATAAMMSLGEVENPVTKKKEKDLQAAKYHIDILEMLSEKTKGNLSQQEDTMLSEILYTLRLKYVEQTKS